MTKKIALLLFLIPASNATASSLSFTINSGGYFVPISDNGPGDLDPTDGILSFDQTLFFGLTTLTAVEIKGTLLYLPGTPIPGGQTDFGIRLTNFSEKVVRDDPGTQNVPTPNWTWRRISPAAAANLILFTMNYLPGCVNHGELCSEYDLPSSGVALVSAPEPKTIGLLAIGLLLFGLAKRKVLRRPSLRLKILIH